LESRKYQLQQQIIEALKANDNDLYTLLKSQWAHRFGVESLEELKNLDLNLLNQNSINTSNQKNDHSKENSLEDDQSNSIKDDNSQGTGIEIKEFKSTKDVNDEPLKIKSYEIIDKQNHVNQTKSEVKTNKIKPKVQALIPLPPKPKYSYLKKWLLRK